MAATLRLVARRLAVASCGLLALAVWLEARDALAGAGVSSQTMSPAELFQSRAVNVSAPAVLPKWAEMLDRFALQSAEASGRFLEARTEFRRMVAAMAALAEMDRIRAVDAYFNRIPYRDDRLVYGTVDYWATPLEFIDSAAGDCEDYVAAKLLTLIEAGTDPQTLRLVVYFDRSDQIYHAVLVAKVAGDLWVLDNRAKEISKWDDAARANETAYAASTNDVWAARTRSSFGVPASGPASSALPN